MGVAHSFSAESNIPRWVYLINIIEKETAKIDIAKVDVYFSNGRYRLLELVVIAF